MDYTLDLCKIKSSFYSNKDNRRLEVIKFQVPYTRKDNFIRPKIIYNKFPLHGIEEEDEENIDTLEKINPLKIGTSIFSNINPIIMANIDSVIGITSYSGGLIANSNMNDYTFCEISDPKITGFPSEYFQFRLPNSIGWNINFENSNVILPKSLDMERYNVLFQDDLNKISKEILSYNVEGIDLVINMRTDLESILFSILFSLLNLKEGGNFILKIKNKKESNILSELLYTIAYSFEEFYYFKPISTSVYNRERYAIGKSLRPRSSIGNIINILTNLNNKVNYITQIFEKIPNDFIDYVNNRNIFIENQASYYDNLKSQYLSGKKVILPEYNVSKILIIFNLPGNKDPNEISETKEGNKDKTVNSKIPEIIFNKYFSLSLGVTNFPSDPTEIILNEEDENVS